MPFVLFVHLYTFQDHLLPFTRQFTMVNLASKMANQRDCVSLELRVIILPMNYVG